VRTCSFSCGCGRRTAPPSDEETRRMSAKYLQGQDYRALAASRLGGPDAVITPAQVAAIRVPTLASSAPRTRTWPKSPPCRR
jgi:hypothetical protein